MPNSSPASALGALTYAWKLHVVPDRSSSVAAAPDTVVEQLSSLYAPTASVSPESATDMPNSSPASSLGALTYAWRLHVVPDRPLSVAAVPDTLVEQLSSLYVATASVSPESATAWPNWSLASALGAFTYASITNGGADGGELGGEGSGEGVYTYAAPAPSLSVAAVPDTLVEQLSSYLAPTANVSPESATTLPKLSPPSALGALTYACKLHAVPVRVGRDGAQPTARLVVAAGRAAALIQRPHGERVARKRHRGAKVVIRLSIGCLDVRLEAPRRAASGVHVDRARIGAAVVGGGGAGHARRAARRRQAKVVAGLRIGRLDVRLEAPRRAGPRVHVDRARIRAVVVSGGGARHARRAAVLIGRPHGERVARERHRLAKKGAGLHVGRLDIRLEAPRRARPRVHVDRSRIRAVVVGGGGARHSGRAAVLFVRPHGERVVRECHRGTKLKMNDVSICRIISRAKGVAGLRIGRLDVRLQAPRRARPRVHVDRARLRAAVVNGGGARHGGRAAVLTVRPHGERVTRKRHRHAKGVAGLRIGRLDVRLQAPRRARPRVHVDRARCRAAVVGGGGARHACRAAVLTVRPHGERVTRKRHRPAKPVVGLRIGRLHVRLHLKGRHAGAQKQDQHERHSRCQEPVSAESEAEGALATAANRAACHTNAPAAFASIRASGQAQTPVRGCTHLHSLPVAPAYAAAAARACPPLRPPGAAAAAMHLVGPERRRFGRVDAPRSWLWHANRQTPRGCTAPSCAMP
eukprot:scaffold5970_cov69-Phaeocystis_antarctica.AAC.2